MGIFSDGSTDITIDFIDETPIPTLDKAVRRSAGGKLKSQTSGQRWAMNLRFRTTGAVSQSLLDLLDNGADEYYYTPNDTHTLYTANNKVTFPINVVFSKIKREWDNRSKYYMSILAEAVSYL